MTFGVINCEGMNDAVVVAGGPRGEFGGRSWEMLLLGMSAVLWDFRFCICAALAVATDQKPASSSAFSAR